jgi:serine/threonine-protein kinase PknG
VAPAAFGLARLRVGRNDVHAAVEALDLVPPTSRAYPEARRLRAVQLYSSDGGLPVLAEAMNSITGVRLDPTEQAELTAQILERALAAVTAKGPQSQLKIGTYSADNNSLRDGLEQTYRVLAQASDDEQERYRLVDRANRVRRWTLT